MSQAEEKSPKCTCPDCGCENCTCKTQKGIAPELHTALTGSSMHLPYVEEQNTIQGPEVGHRPSGQTTHG